VLQPCLSYAAKKRCASTDLFYAISFQSVNSKACGSKTASLIFIFLKANCIKMQRKDIAACHHTGQPKDYGIKTQSPPHKSHHFYSVSFWPSLMPLMLVAKHFLLHFIF